MVVNFYCNFQHVYMWPNAASSSCFCMETLTFSSWSEDQLDDLNLSKLMVESCLHRDPRGHWERWAPLGPQDHLALRDPVDSLFRGQQ